MNHIDAILQMDLTQYAIKMGYNKLIKGQLTSSWISLKNESLNDTIRIKQKRPVFRVMTFNPIRSIKWFNRCDTFFSPIGINPCRIRPAK